MSTNEQNYRPLGPDEVIQAGDEYRGIGLSKWQQCVFSIGIIPKDWPEFEFRRPIPAEQEPKEGDYYACCPECGHLNDGHFTDCLKPIVDSLRAQLAESEKKRAEAEHIIEWIKTHFQTNGLTNEHSRDDRVYICGIHHVLMAAYHDVKKYVECNARLGKEIVELRIRAEKAERERDEARATIESIRMVVVKLDGSCSTSRIIEEVEHVILAWNKRAADAIAERDRLQAELEAIKSASGQFETHHNFKTVIDGIHHMRHKIGEFAHQITSLQAELAKCREALKSVAGDIGTTMYRLSKESEAMVKAALEGGK